LESHFVTNFVVQHQPDHFVLSFFEVWPPPILGDTEKERQDQIEKVDYIDANCVARVIVTPDKMSEFLHTISENIKKYEEMMSVKSKLDKD
jgi:hypothetical protein